jgi:hypothetical protein
MKAFLIFSLLILSALMATAQKWSVEIGTSPFTPFEFANRYSNPNGHIGFFKEIRIGYSIAKHWNIVAFAGHQERTTLAYMDQFQTGQWVGIKGFQVSRNLVPIGGMVQYHNEKWINQWLKSKHQKWRLRSQIGLYTIVGKDSFDKNMPPGDFRFLDSFPDYYGNLHWLATAGIGYKLSKNWQLHAEGGWGALSHCTLHLAYSW